MWNARWSCRIFLPHVCPATLIFRFSSEYFELPDVKSRDAEPEPEPEPEPPEPTHFGRSRSRSRSRRNGLLGAGAGAGAVRNGAAPAPKRDTIVARKKQQQNQKKQPNWVCLNFSSITRTSAMNYLKFYWLTKTCIWYDLNIKQVLN